MSSEILTDPKSLESFVAGAGDSEQEALLRKTKKLMVINSDLYVRNYLQSGMIDQIEDEHFYFIASDHLKLKADLEAKANFLGYFHYDDTTFDRCILLSNVLMRRYQNLSSTFKFRFVRLEDKVSKKLSVKAMEKTRTYKQLQKLLKFMPQGLRSRLSLGMTRFYKFFSLSQANKETVYSRFLSHPMVTPLYLAAFKLLVKPNQQLEKAIAKLQPDLVLFPTTAIDPPGYDLIRLQEKLNFKSLFLIENWDNLSSKTVFINPPHYLGVWGQQSVDHALQIHNIPAEKVFPIGTPRFQAYYDAMARFDQEGTLPPSPYPFKYILFAGYSWPFDELSALKVLDDAMTELNQTLPEPLKIVYRPHPWRFKRSCPDMFYPENFRNVVLDLQLVEHYYNKTPEGYYQPALDYYPNLLINCEMAVGGLTSLMIEVCICRKKIVALAYDDGVHLANPANAIQHNKHYEGVYELPNLFFVEKASELADVFKQTLLKRDSDIDWVKQAEKVQYYHYHDHRSYQQRVKSLMAHVLTH